MVGLSCWFRYFFRYLCLLFFVIIATLLACGIGSDPDPTNPFGFGSGAILQPYGDSGLARRDIRPLEVAILASGMA